jgi:hypothetical protein
MNKQLLLETLRREKFRSDCYDLDSDLLPERLTLANEAGQWCVYYSERGQQTGKRCFATESEACEYLLSELRDEPSARA